MFSSPAACIKTINNRINTLKKSEDDSYLPDIHALEELAEEVKLIKPMHFSKYQKLVTLLADPKQGWGWAAKDTNDRIVIFTERIETLRFLEENLRKDLKLKNDQITVLYGTMSDVEQQKVVEDFGKDEAPIRLLIASDVASEGINLHYLCHRLIHFDIPWSLMVFQQRNGRVDRYGQEQTPEIVYLVTDSQNSKIRGDTRILELLIRKDDQAVKNIGDPAAFMGVYDIDEEEKKTAEAIEANRTAKEFEKQLEASVFDPLALLMDDSPPPTGQDAIDMIAKAPSLFKSDFEYLKAAIAQLRSEAPMQVEFIDNTESVTLTAPDELKDRFRFLPSEILPDDGVFVLSTDKSIMQGEIKRSRKDEKAWPKIHYLWGLNPIMDWVNDKALAYFGRHEAPVVILENTLDAGEVVFLMTGLIPNQKGHPLIQRWFGVVFSNGQFKHIEDLEALIKRTGLGVRQIPNRGIPANFENLKKSLPSAVDKARQWMSARRKEFEDQINEKLNQHLTDLERLKKGKLVQLELRFSDIRQPEKLAEALKEKEKREIDKIFDEYMDWVEQTMTTEDQAYIRVVAALTGRF